MCNITTRFSSYLIKKAESISVNTLEKANVCQKDYMAVAYAGARKNEARWKGFLDQAPNGKALVVGYDQRKDDKTAALVNGFNAHSLELDDGHRYAMIHLGASIISAINAARDYHFYSEEQALTGIVMGYEAACRVAIAMQPEHKNRGFHTAGTCGTIGAAVGVAFSMGMDRSQIERVLTGAVSSAAGILGIQEQNSEMKPYNVGRAALDGLVSAYMGLTDYRIPEDILGVEQGFLHIYSGIPDIPKLTHEHEYFEIDRIYIKPYASCRHSHSAVEAAIKLHKEVNCREIESVKVETYKLGVKGHDHTKIVNLASAKLSTPYAVAVSLLYGKADLPVFEPLDREAVQLAQKVKVVESDELTKVSPDKRAAIVTVTLVNGTSRRMRIDYAKGEPENPMTQQELDEKWDSLYKWGSSMFDNQILNREGYLK